MGDNQNAPYGNKSEEELKRLTLQNVTTLINYGAKIIILACNTLSTTVLNYITESEVVKSNNAIIVGVFPPIIDMQTATLICTPLTAKSNYVKTNYHKTKITPLPFLAGEIERYLFTPEKINFKADVKSISDAVKTLILGCTHYSLFTKEFQKLLPGVKVVDGLDNTVNEVIIKCKTIKTTNNIVTCNHHALKTLKPVVVNGNRVYFIEKSHQYNKKVFKFILK